MNGQALPVYTMDWNAQSARNDGRHEYREWIVSRYRGDAKQVQDGLDVRGRLANSPLCQPAAAYRTTDDFKSGHDKIAYPLAVVAAVGHLTFVLRVDDLSLRLLYRAC